MPEAANEHLAVGAQVPSLRVRRASEVDLPVVCELRLALLHEHRGHSIYSRVRADAPARARSLYLAQLRSPNEVTLLAESGQTVLGILRCVESQGLPMLDPLLYGYVSSVYVRPAARRHGVLHALLRHAEHWCRVRGLTEMRLHSAIGNDASNAAWDALGFAPAEILRIRRL